LATSSVSNEDEVRRLVSTMPNLSIAYRLPSSSCAAIFVPSITQLAKLSFSEGIFPTRYKTVSVTSLLKKDLRCYQQLWLQPLHTISKMLERLFMARIWPHVKSCRLLSVGVHARSLNRNHAPENVGLCHYRSLLLQLDLSATFDTLNKPTLSRLCHTFSVRGTSQKWVDSYLNERSQCVRVGDRVSSSVSCHYGVTRKRDHITLLTNLYWLPVTARMQFKIFKTLTTHQPSYIHDLLQQHRSSRQLRSSGHNLLEIPQMRTGFAQRNFPYSAPNL